MHSLIHYLLSSNHVLGSSRCLKYSSSKMEKMPPLKKLTFCGEVFNLMIEKY